MSPRTHNIGRIVAGSLVAGLLTAIILVAIPFAGAPENVISGAVLVAFGLGWALLAILSTVRTDQPQRWAALPAGVFVVAGFMLIAWPGSVKVVALEWLWPPVLLALVAWMAVRARGQLHSRARAWLVYPVFGILALSAVGAAYENAQEVRDRALY